MVPHPDRPFLTDDSPRRSHLQHAETIDSLSISFTRQNERVTTDSQQRLRSHLLLLLLLLIYHRCQLLFLLPLLFFGGGRAKSRVERDATQVRSSSVQHLVDAIDGLFRLWIVGGFDFGIGG